MARKMINPTIYLVYAHASDQPITIPTARLVMICETQELARQITRQKQIMADNLNCNATFFYDDGTLQRSTPVFHSVESFPKSKASS